MPVTITGDITVWVTHFLLIVTRMTGMFTLSPVFGRANVPAMLKILLSVMLSFLLVAFYPPPAQPYGRIFALLILGELLIGLIMGYVTIMFFNAVFTAGHIIDTQIGFGMVQVYDVTSNIQIPIAGSLFNIILLLCFFLTDGHLRLIQIMFRTFEVIPVGGAVFRPELATLMVEGFCITFGVAVNVAIPVMASGLLAEVALGVISRTAPQMNMFVIGIPLKTILGLLILAAIIPVFVGFTNSIFDQMFIFIGRVFENMI